MTKSCPIDPAGTPSEPHNRPDPESTIGLPASAASAAEVRAALAELVRLKDVKTQFGETADYRTDRERAWEEARRVLERG